MRVWFDTEFYEYHPTEPYEGRKSAGANAIQLISIGAVREDGEEFYAENRDFEWSNVPPGHWLWQNVKPMLDVRLAYSPRFIADEFRDFCGIKPEFWAYYADYDWVVLCGLYGRMLDLPSGWPMVCFDIKQLSRRLPYGPSIDLPLAPADAHHALADARWNRKAYEHVVKELHAVQRPQ